MENSCENIKNEIKKDLHRNGEIKRRRKGCNIDWRTQTNIVKQMFNDYLTGMRLKDIVEKLIKGGIKNTYGKNFTINSVSRIYKKRKL